MLTTKDFFNSLALVTENQTLCFRFLNPKQKPITTCYKDFSSIDYEELERNNKTHDAFYTLNEVSEGFKGNPSASDIKRIRCLVIDFDSNPMPETWPEGYTPNIVVKTGKGHHVYFFSEEPVNLSDFRKLQTHLAIKFGGDRLIIDLPRIMRIPGTVHLKDPSNPIQTEILSINATTRVKPSSWDLSNVPVPKAVEYKSPSQEELGTLEERVSRFRSYMKKYPPAIQGEGGRAHTLKVGCIAGDFFIEKYDDVKDILEEWNTICKPRWDLIPGGDETLRELFDQGIRARERPLGCRLVTPPPTPQEPVEGETRIFVTRSPGLNKSTQDINNEYLAWMRGTNHYIHAPSSSVIQSPIGQHPMSLEDFQERTEATLDSSRDGSLFPYVTFYEHKKKHDQPCQSIPRNVRGAIGAHLLKSGLPIIERVVSHPFVHDNELIVEPGYHEKSKTWLLPYPYLEETRELKQDNARAKLHGAMTRFYDLFKTFPFHAPESLAAYLSSLLSPLMLKPSDLHPLTLFNANKPGSGKSLLASIAIATITGKVPSTQTFPSNPEEFQKELVSILHAGGKDYLFYDNIKTTIDSAALEGAITSTIYEGRVLSRSLMTKGAIPYFYMTANNAEVSSDLRRRSVIISLDAKKPHDGDKLTVVSYLKNHQKSIMLALLTIIQAWLTENNNNRKFDFFKAASKFQGWKPIEDTLTFDSWDEGPRAAVLWATKLYPPTDIWSILSPDAPVDPIWESDTHGVGTPDTENTRELIEALLDLMATNKDFAKGVANKDLKEIIKDPVTPQDKRLASTVPNKFKSDPYKYVSKHKHKDIDGRRITCSVINGITRWYIADLDGNKVKPTLVNTSSEEPHTGFVDLIID